MRHNRMCEREELSDQTKDLYQELVAGGAEVWLGVRAHDILEASRVIATGCACQ